MTSHLLITLRRRVCVSMCGVPPFNFEGVGNAEVNRFLVIIWVLSRSTKKTTNRLALSEKKHLFCIVSN